MSAATRSLGLAALFAIAPASAWAVNSPGPLAAVHQGIDTPEQCATCHTSGRELANDKCLGCHDHENLRRRIAEHKGFHASEKVGSKACYLCHTDHKGREKDILGWVTVGGKDKFDHKLSGFLLDGAHASLKCEQCHKKRSFIGTPTTCEGCHKSTHGELRAPLKRCERCHTQKSWQPLAAMAFNHDDDADARFPLAGKHAAVACASCHTKGLFRKAGAPAPDCTPCHKDIHNGKFGKSKCSQCHSPADAWTRTSFDHARQARFPLDGAHAKLACESCHSPDKPKVQRACDSCHKEVHGNRFAKFSDCGACHTAKRWADLSFNHFRQAGYKLTGKHAEVGCRKCHRGNSPTEFERLEGIVSKAGVACMSCHQHTEVHKGQFKNTECLRCHLGAGKMNFKPEAVNRFHGPDARFPLSEGHEGVACDKCHKNDVYQGTPLDCGGACHQDVLHKGTLGPTCSRCHQGGRWTPTSFDHDDSAFPLYGKHEQARCEECHVERAFKPTPQRCAECHAKDDAHHGTLGSDCERCHSPSGRFMFDHNDPKAKGRFRLEGKHAAVACSGCHKASGSSKAPTACEGCHVEPDKHRGQLGTRCASCHDVTDWKHLHTGHESGGLRFGGAHDRRPCAECHAGGRELRGTGALCISCHRGDDIHHNAIAAQCGDCHKQESWSGAQVRFIHERTGCDLRGLHRTLPCLDCHVGGNFTALSPTCVSCHRGDSVRAARDDKRAPPGHAGYSTCTPCHNVNYFMPSRPGGSESVCQ